jgi:6-phosphogluconolactonase
MVRVWRRSVEVLLGLVVLGGVTLTTGCGAFFQCEGKTSCGGSGSTTDTGDVVFATNSGSTNLYAYSLGSDGSLNTVSGSPFALSLPPVSMVVTPDNSLLYVSNGNGITSYIVSSTGVLSNGTTQSVALVPEQSMVVTPNGEFLLALDASNLNTGGIITLREYVIGSGGTLSTSSNSNATGFNVGTNTGQLITPYQIAVSPKGDYIAMALGSAGYQVFGYNQSTGVFASTGAQGTGNSSIVGDHSVAFDGSDNVYIARTNGGATGTGIVVYSTAKGTEVSPSTPYATGNAPQSLLFASNYGFLYTANRLDSTITASSVTAGVVSSLGADISAPVTVQALALDSSGKYVLAEGATANSGLQVFTIGTSGGLTAGNTAIAGTANNAVPVLAVTH